MTLRLTPRRPPLVRNRLGRWAPTYGDSDDRTLVGFGAIGMTRGRTDIRAVWSQTNWRKYGQTISRSSDALKRSATALESSSACTCTRNTHSIFRTLAERF